MVRINPLYLYQVFESFEKKYSTVVPPDIRKFLPENLEKDSISLLSACQANSSWKKHNSALNAFRLFERSSPVIFNWPLSRSCLLSFSTWCFFKKELKPKTITAYLASLSFLHKLKDFSTENFNDFKLNMLLKGASNLQFYKNISANTRKAMTLPLLKLLGHEIAISKFSPNDKKVFWTASCIAFFGSFRCGELFSSNEKVFNPNETLLWKDVEIKDDHVKIWIKIPKSKNPKGEHIELFSFPGHNCCPLLAIKNLKNFEPRNADSPVFTLENGTFLTIKLFNQTIRNFLEPHLGCNANLISGHSFRAAVPSILALNPNIANDEDIKKWGRWNSSCFNLYTRLSLERKRIIFEKIIRSMK